MTRQLISSGSAFEKEFGYSRAVVDGDWVFVSGTTGFDYAAGTLPEGVADQAEQALRNIEAALKQAGAAMTDVVRLHVFLAARDDFPKIAPVFGKWFGEIRPANTTVIADLVDGRMKIEIEVTALKGGAAA